MLLLFRRGLSSTAGPLEMLSPLSASIVVGCISLGVLLMYGVFYGYKAQGSSYAKRPIGRQNGRAIVYTGEHSYTVWGMYPECVSCIVWGLVHVQVSHFSLISL